MGTYRRDAYQIPDDLTGKSVLDVGAWMGYWTIEAARRGAEWVCAMDDFSDTIGSAVNADRAPKWQQYEIVPKCTWHKERHKS